MSNNNAFGRVTTPSSRPPFLVDRDAIVLDTGRQIAWELLDSRYQYGSVPIEISADEAADQTAVSVVALPVDLPAGTVLQFGLDKYATLTADAAAGDTEITVQPLTTALVDGDIAYYDADVLPGKHVKAGTVMDLLTDGRIVPSAMATGGGVTAIGLLATNADEISETDAITGYGLIKSAAVYENLLPEANGADPSVIDSNWKTELLARGGFWMFEQYADNT